MRQGSDALAKLVYDYVPDADPEAVQSFVDGYMNAAQEELR